MSITRKPNGDGPTLSSSIVALMMCDNGVLFIECRCAIADDVIQAHVRNEIYNKARPNYSGRVTVPVLCDKERGTIVNNESSEIIRMFNLAFNRLPGVNAALDLNPEFLCTHIDRINATEIGRAHV